MSIAGGQTQSKSGGSGRIFYGYWIVAALVIINFIPVTFFMSCNATFMPAVADALEESPGVIGYVLSVFSLGNTLLFPIFGRLFAKYDSRILCTIGIVVLALAFVCQSLVTEAWQFIACGVLLAIGIVPLFFMAPATLINRWFTKRAGFFIGVVLASTGVGGVLWNMVSEALIIDIGFRMTYRLFAIVTLVVGLPLTLFVLRDSPADKGLVPYGSEEMSAKGQNGLPSESEAVRMAATQNKDGMSAHDAYRTSTFKLLLGYAFFLNLGMFVCAMTPSYVRTLDFAAALPLLGATCVSCIMGAQTVAKVLWGAIADKRPIVAVVAGILMGIAGVLCLAFFNDAPWKLYGGTIIFGFFYALSTVTAPILTRYYFGMRDYSIIFSKISMACTMGTFSGSLIWGTTINMTGSFKPMLFGVVCMLTIALVCILLVNRSAKGKSFKKND
ncbi:MAG: MFS transporter [Eggerthellaceae bacterium]|nr:MFS transporter [Eggerthellaceae bacterium]